MNRIKASMMNAFVISSLLAFVSAANTTTRYFNWKLSWKTVNPDGLKDRQVVAINDQWPMPVVRVNMGDRVIVNVTNELKEPARNSSIHFHGLFQNGTNDMDGPPMIVQCATAPGVSFIYNFTVDQPGTYWYHAHVENLYPDGYRQLFLVENDDAWFKDQVDDEISFTLSDWYHEVTADIADEDFMSLYNPTGAEPVPKSILFNDTLAPKWSVKPNKTYRLRIANIGAFSGFYVYIPNHPVTVVEVDGVYTEPAEAKMIYISAAQRYSVLFNTTSNPEEVYQIVQIADSALYDLLPSDLQLNRTGFLYTGNPSEDKFVQADHESIFKTAPIWNRTDNSEVAAPNDDLSVDSYTSDNLIWFDDFQLVPYDRMPLLEPVSVNHTLHLTMSNLYDGKPYSFFNDITWTAAKVPTLFSVLSAPNDDIANNATIYGTDTHPIVLNHNDIVQIIMNNDDTGKHPFHLHGHNFQAVLRGPDQGEEAFVPYDPSTDDGKYPEFPMRRDVFVVLPNSHFLIRFRADNPGVWFFHCHIEWHLTQGLALEFIEAPAQIRQNYKVHPLAATHQSSCQSVKVTMKGNAASNFNDFFDLNGENRQVKFLPSTFTARGIVALVFSIICAFVGMGFLCWYGSTDITSAENREVVRAAESAFAGANETEVEETEGANQETNQRSYGSAGNQTAALDRN